MRPGSSGKYPYSWAPQYGAGRVLKLLVESTIYDVPGLDSVPHIDAVATEEQGKTSLFLLNRDLSKAHGIEMVWQDQPESRVIVAQVLTGPDLKAVNGFDAPERVKPQELEKPSILNGRTRFEVPAHSYTIIQWGPA